MQNAAVGIGDCGQPGVIRRAVGMSVLHTLRAIVVVAVLLMLGKKLAEIVVDELHAIVAHSAVDDMLDHAPHLVAAPDAQQRRVDVLAKGCHLVIDRPAKIVEREPMHRAVLIGPPDDLLLAIILELHPVVKPIDAVPQSGGVVGVGIDDRPEPVVAVDLRRNPADRRAIDILCNLVAGGGIFRRQGQNCPIDVVSFLDGDVLIVGRFAIPIVLDGLRDAPGVVELGAIIPPLRIDPLVVVAGRVKKMRKLAIAGENVRNRC
jgi:hypothetical protein